VRAPSAPDALAIVRTIAGLAAVDHRPWLAELRLALAKVPPAQWDDVELSIETWDALLEDAWPVLESCAADGTGVLPGSPEDEGAVEDAIYQLACGLWRVEFDRG
jgi:hypothetical protein